MQTELVLVQEVLALLPQNRGEQVAVVREEPRRFGRPLRAALDGGTVLLSRDRGEGVEVRYRARRRRGEQEEANHSNAAHGGGK